MSEKMRQINRRWVSYLAGFHQEKAGMKSELLLRAMAGPGDPYRWLARAVSNKAKKILDVGCGAGIVTQRLSRPDRTIVGVDISLAELEIASRSPGIWLQATGLQLPFVSESFDVVTSVMGLAVIHPIETLVSEMVRVLKPGGVLAGLVPSFFPKNPKDTLFIGQLAFLLRMKPNGFGIKDVSLAPLLDANGLKRIESARERYRFLISNRKDANFFIEALYLPNTTESRKRSAVDWLARKVVSSGPYTVPLTVRRIVAIK